jgi:hypothetical protein
LTILEEALTKYDVDGLFFNMFGNPSTDFSGVAMGPCQCDASQTLYCARYGKPVLPSDGRCRCGRTRQATPSAGRIVRPATPEAYEVMVLE